MKIHITGFLVLLLAALAISGGCIRMVQNGIDAQGTPGDSLPESMNTDASSAISGALVPSAAPSGMGTVPAGSGPASVIEVDPEVTPDPYPVMHGTRFNDTWNFSHLGGPGYVFEKTYDLRSNATGLLVNVTKGPLYILYEVTPQNDCLKTPDSCRGDMTKPVNRPYLTITVRDNATREIVARDGYGREYSSDTGLYTFELTGENADGILSSGGSDGTNTIYPVPRSIKIYREGVFRITFEGDFLSVDVKIRTGAEPLKSESAIPDTPSPPAEEEHPF